MAARNGEMTTQIGAGLFVAIGDVSQNLITSRIGEGLGDAMELLGIHTDLKDYTNRGFRLPCECSVLSTYRCCEARLILPGR